MLGWQSFLFDEEINASDSLTGNAASETGERSTIYDAESCPECLMQHDVMTELADCLCCGSRVETALKYRDTESEYVFYEKEEVIRGASG